MVEEKTKYEVRIFSATIDEDLVRLMSTINQFRVWAIAKHLWNVEPTVDVSDLFEEFGKCLGGTAFNDWIEIMERRALPSTSKTWNLFKSCVAEYIVKMTTPTSIKWTT